MVTKLNSNQIAVEWSNGNQQWCIIGGGLPFGACWSAHASLNEAIREADALADEMGFEVAS